MTPLISLFYELLRSWPLYAIPLMRVICNVGRWVYTSRLAVVLVPSVYGEPRRVFGCDPDGFSSRPRARGGGGEDLFCSGTLCGNIPELIPVQEFQLCAWNQTEREVATPRRWGLWFSACLLFCFLTSATAHLSESFPSFLCFFIFF